MSETRVESRESRENLRKRGTALPIAFLNSRLSSLDSGATFLFAGGGSGGHLFPGIAVAQELAARDPRCRIVFVGSERGIERTVLAGTPWWHVPLPILPPAAARKRPVRFAAGFAASVRAAIHLLHELQPAAVIGLGGFASVPVALAARLRHVPLVLLEQNVIPGRATTFLSRWAKTICVSFPATVPLLSRKASALVTGNPLRKELRRPRTKDSRKTLLILGGSQRSAGLNEMVLAAVCHLRDDLRGWHVVHQTGERDAARVHAAYGAAGVVAEVAPFFDDLPTRYTGATLAITRAGATTLAELACAGVPAVLVPYPRSARDHQQRNAEHYASAGAATVVLEGAGATDRLVNELSTLLGSSDRLGDMAAAMRRLARPDAAENVADLLLPRAAAAMAA